MIVGACALLCAGGLLAQQPQPAAAGALARQLNDAFAGVYEKVAPSVVVIEVRRTADAAVPGMPEGLDVFFRGPNGRPVPTKDQGSGFIISQDGYILTSQHVVAGATAGEVIVRLKDGRKFPGRVVGRDDKSDIAVLKIEAAGLPAAEMGDSDAVKVGNFAFAIGAPFDLPYTFTVGVVSAKGRNDITGSQSYEEYIQTDASINPGNSGGPLCDLDGRVIGVNALISTTDQGMGFAVPINVARDVGTQLIASGRVVRPWLGIGILGIADSELLQSHFPTLESGVFVSGIEPGTPAAGSGLQRGDVILKVDGVIVPRSRDLQREILGKKIGAAVNLEVWREGKTSTISLRTAEQPDRVVPAAFRSQRRLPSPPGAAQAVPGAVYGLLVEDLPADAGAKGVRVAAVEAGSPADAAGFQVGDLLTEVAGKPVQNARQVGEVLKSMDPARGVMFFLQRDGQRTFRILKP